MNLSELKTSEENLGQNFLHRTSFIEKLKKDDAINQIPIFSGSSSEVFVPVYMIDINFPIYRLANIRTKSDQVAYITKNNKTSDFFSADSESREALLAQHCILYDIAISGAEEKNHYKVFEEGAFDKAHPMMMTFEGVLINGNTRMSALRELYYSNSTLYERYAKLPIAVLPSTLTEKDIRKLELNLQINPDIHKDYPWISEAMDCKEQFSLHQDIEEIVKEYKRQPNDVSYPVNLLNELQMADLFLEMYDAKGQYKLLEKDQFALLEWHNWGSKNRDYDQRLKVIDCICFETIRSKIQNYRSQSGDLYKQLKKYHRITADNPMVWSEFFRQYSIDTKVDPKDQTVSTAIEDEYDFLNENLDLIPETESAYKDDQISDLIKTNVLAGKTGGIQLLETVDSVVGAVEEEQKRSKSNNIIYDLVMQSLGQIQDCIRRINDEGKSFERLPDALQNITLLEKELKVLRDKIQEKVN